eukprot:Awhi_evm1s8401
MKGNTTGDPSELIKIALVIRMGGIASDAYSFLNERDIKKFLECLKNWLILYNSRKKDVAVFLSTDKELVYHIVTKELEKESLRLVYEPAPIVHVQHASISDESIVKTFVDLFMIGWADYGFLTHFSLFGHFAAIQGTMRSENMFFISAADCDSKTKQYSFVDCHNPKYPSFCSSPSN